MDPRHTIDNMTGEEFTHILQQYNDYMPAKLKELDELRFVTIPKAVQSRREKNEDDVFLTKPELESLIQWKLKHGTFRPNLAKLISSNTPRAIHQLTSMAFNAHISNPRKPYEHLKLLTPLHGVGPATASLILTCVDPANVPFFSDELYRYVLWEEGKGKGWDRKIGYTLKEYATLCGKLEELRERLRKDEGKEVGAGEVEMVAYVLGKRALGEQPNKGIEREPEEVERPLRKKRQREEDELKGPGEESLPPSPPARKLRSRQRTTITESSKNTNETLPIT